MMKNICHALLLLGFLLAVAPLWGQSEPGLRLPAAPPPARFARALRLPSSAAPARPAPDLRASLLSAPGAPLAWRYEELAFFCRLEVQLEKAARLPVRFRLGDVRYVDYLEGKREAYE